MGWDSKHFYPTDAVHRMSLKATYAQKIAWQSAATRHGKGTAGAFLAWAADFTIVVLNGLETMQGWPDDPR